MFLLANISLLRSLSCYKSKRIDFILIQSNYFPDPSDILKFIHARAIIINTYFIIRFINKVARWSKFSKKKGINKIFIVEHQSVFNMVSKPKGKIRGC